MKKLLSVLLALALVLSLGVTAVAADDGAALSVYTQTGEGEAVLAKSYTADELDALKEIGTPAYVYSGKSGASAVVATEYVTMDALFADAGVTFAEGDSLSFTCDDGPYSKWVPTYADLAARGVDDQGAAVPTAFALTWDSGDLADGAAAIAATAKNSGSIRFVCGMTEEEAKDNSGRGMRMPSGVVSVTVVSPEQPALSIYTQYADAEPELLKDYTAAELAALAETGTAAYVYYKGGATNAVVATEYVTLDVLLTDAGATFASADELHFTCDDGPYTKLKPTFNELRDRGVDADGNVVPTAFALTWETGNLDEESAADVAARAINSGSIRFVSGMTEAEKEAASAAGNRMPSGVVSVTVVIPRPVATASRQSMMVDGKTVTAEYFVINQENYIKLRDMAALLTGTSAQFNVTWDQERFTAPVTTGEAYVPVGGELELHDRDLSRTELSTVKLEIDGVPTALRLYLIDGNNYFRLRDLGPALGFSVTYDPDADAIVVTTA